MNYSRLRETQDTISRWANATFGNNGSNYSLCCRANEKLGKALQIHSLASSDIARLVDTLADTMILLYQFAGRIDFDGDAAAKGKNLDFSPLVTPGSIITKCNQLMAALISFVEDDDFFRRERGKVNRILENLFPGLYFLASVLGHEMTQAIDIRMSERRAREKLARDAGPGARVRISENVGCFVPSHT